MLIKSISKTLQEFFGDREFITELRRIAIPVALNNLSFSILNMVSVLMVGQLGEVSVAAVGLANQITFLLNLLLFGITSGMAIFTAQLWGRRDIANIRKVLGLALTLGVVGGAVFFIGAQFFPATLLSIYSNDSEVVRVGVSYLKIVGWTFLVIPFTVSYSVVLRSVGQVNLPVVVSTSALGFNALLSYGLIFGKMGLPELGIPGTAVASLISRILECTILLALNYRFQTPAAASLRELFSFDLRFTTQVLKPVLPVALNEMLWSFGITTYNIIYARIGTEAIAAINIATTIDSLAVVMFIGIANGCAVLVGNLIGAKDYDKAQLYGKWALNLSVVGAMGMGLMVVLVSPWVLTWYKVSPEVITNARFVLIVIACFLWLRMSNLLLFIGILRAGGDTRFALILDGVIIWIVGVPSALAGAFLFHFSVYWVYLMVMSEELTKWLLALWRFRAKKWIHNLTENV